MAVAHSSSLALVEGETESAIMGGMKKVGMISKVRRDLGDVHMAISVYRSRIYESILKAKKDCQGSSLD